ncbi:MAG: CoA-binding protein [Desulfobacteraceae bacterium]|nr:CoA-binding protein [Desulfobacteraceae bacterium]
MKNSLDAFLNPKSVAVIGATDRPGSWGSFIMQGLLSKDYAGRIYPVNPNAETVFGIPAFQHINDIGDPVDLAIITIPLDSVERAIADCGQRQVKGATIITAGYGEASKDGKAKENTLVRMARSHGMHLLGPNVSGTFNLHADFNASASPAEHLLCNRIAAVCQGGYAFYDLLASGFSRGMGVGKFVHTGNECDVTATDFLEYFGDDPDVEVILMYLETVRDARRFVEMASRISKVKPIVVYKGGRTRGSARAAESHTGALSGVKELYEGVLHQTGIIASPTMELLLPLGHALLERPPMRGKRVAIVTMGGSWGVALSDALEELGLTVPELSQKLQQSLRGLGMLPRASTKNPVDIGASGLFFEEDVILAIGREILSSGEVDAVVLHGMGRPGMLREGAPARLRIFLDINKRIISGFNKMEKETGLPVLIGSIYTPWESQVVCDLNEQGIRIYNRLDEIAQILCLMHKWRQKKRRWGLLDG